MINFHVGQDVVCINNEDPKNVVKKYLTVGNKYTIRWIGPFNTVLNGKFEEIIAVKLLSITRPMIHKEVEIPKETLDLLFSMSGLAEDYFDDAPFAAWRFKPLDSVEKSMDILKGLLNSKELPEDDDDDGYYNPEKRKVLEDV